jgi:predicted PurR-regulated permease PerM
MERRDGFPVGKLADCTATSGARARTTKQIHNRLEFAMNKDALKLCALSTTVVAALTVGGLVVATPAMAQVGSYYDYAPDYGPGPGWGPIIANSNHSVPFDPADAALSYRYGKSYGYCGFTIAGC